MPDFGVLDSLDDLVGLGSHSFSGVDGSGMVAPAVKVSNLLASEVSESPAQSHRQHPRDGDGSGSDVAGDVEFIDLAGLGDGADDGDCLG